MTATVARTRPSPPPLTLLPRPRRAAPVRALAGPCRPSPRGAGIFLLPTDHSWLRSSLPLRAL